MFLGFIPPILEVHSFPISRSRFSIDKVTTLSSYRVKNLQGVTQIGLVPEFPKRVKPLWGKEIQQNVLTKIRCWYKSFRNILFLYHFSSVPVWGTLDTSLNLNPITSSRRKTWYRPDLLSTGWRNWWLGEGNYWSKYRYKSHFSSGYVRDHILSYTYI